MSVLDPSIALEPTEYFKSPTYKPEIPFFTKALNGEEIVEAIEARLAGLEASQFFLAVHWSVLREARDEIEHLRWQIANPSPAKPPA